MICSKLSKERHLSLFRRATVLLIFESKLLVNALSERHQRDDERSYLIIYV